MSTPALHRFLASLDDAQDPRELTYDVNDVPDMADAERQKAEDALIDRIRRLGDVRAIESVIVLGCARAVPVLREVRASPKGPVREAAERALLRLGGDAQALQTLIARLRSPEPIVRENAAYELRKSDLPQATEALLGALEDDNGVVRFHAVAGLNRQHGLVDFDELREQHGPLKRAATLALAKLPALRRVGAVEMRQIVQAVARDGDAARARYNQPPPAAAGPLDAFVDSVHSVGKDYDLAAIQRLPAPAQAWAAAYIACRLEDQDPRAPIALAALGAREFVPTLRELATGDRPAPFLAAVAAALRTLDPDAGDT